MTKKRDPLKELQTKAIEINAKANGLQKQMPMHLKVVPEIKQTLSLINDMSEVLLCLTQLQTQGEPNHADRN